MIDILNSQAFNSTKTRLFLFFKVTAHHPIFFKVQGAFASFTNRMMSNSAFQVPSNRCVRHGGVHRSFYPAAGEASSLNQLEALRDTTATSHPKTTSIDNSLSFQ
jgi:hypothetical protein